MNDEIDILIAGNLRGDARLEQRQGETVATAQVCAAVTSIRAGRVVRQSLCLTVELDGPHAHAFVRQHRAGSRVVLRGYLEERCTTRTECLSRADGPGTVAVTFERHEYVLIIERVLHSGPAEAPTPPSTSTTPRAESGLPTPTLPHSDSTRWRF